MFTLLLSQCFVPSTPHPRDNLAAELNPTAGTEATTSSVSPSTVTINVSESNGVTMKAGELKQ